MTYISDVRNLVAGQDCAVGLGSSAWVHQGFMFIFVHLLKLLMCKSTHLINHNTYTN
jgi:hypothetical protein